MGRRSAFGDADDGFAGEPAVVAGGAGLVRLEDVDEVVGDAGALGERGLCGADLHAAIDGDGVATDDLAGEALGEGEGERGLAAGGGAGDDDECGVQVAYQSRHQPRVKTLCTPARRMPKTIAARASRSSPRTWRRRSVASACFLLSGCPDGFEVESIGEAHCWGCRL
jgi:hypothetical protein